MLIELCYVKTGRR